MYHTNCGGEVVFPGKKKAGSVHLRNQEFIKYAFGLGYCGRSREHHQPVRRYYTTPENSGAYVIARLLARAKRRVRRIHFQNCDRPGNGFRFRKTECLRETRSQSAGL